METHLFRATHAREIDLPYLLRAPRQDSPGPASRGLVVFLHGAGSKGAPSDELANEPIFAAAGHLDRHGLWLAVPRCPAHRSGWPVEDLHVWLTAILERHALDPARVILTGISMGGRGCWEFAYEHGSALAALLPLCGPGMPNLAPRLQGLPVRAFHGVEDEVVPLARSREMQAALLQEGVEARLDELSGAGHGIGRAVYGRREVWAWAARRAESRC